MKKEERTIAVKIGRNKSNNDLFEAIEEASRARPLAVMPKATKENKAKYKKAMDFIKNYGKQSLIKS